MKYILAIWHLQDLKDYEHTPIAIYYEVEDGKSMRGIERFFNNSYTILPSGQDIPSIQVMNDSGGEFTAFEITKSEFELQWKMAKENRSTPPSHET